MPACTGGRERSRGNCSRKERVILMSPHPTADSRTDRDEEGLRETPIFVAPPFRQVTQASGYRRKWIVCRAYAGTRVAYAGRTQCTASTRAFSSFFCAFLGGFARLFEDFLVSQFSDCPKVAPFPGWHSLDGNLPIWAVPGCPLVVRLAQPGWTPCRAVGQCDRRWQREVANEKCSGDWSKCWPHRG